MTTTNIPFGMIDSSGKMLGFDVDFTKQIADRIGVKQRIETYKYPGLIPALTTNKIDMVAAGMTITDARKQIVDFSDPYFEDGKVLIVSKSAAPGMTDYKQFNDPKYQIAVVTGSTDETAAMKYLPKATLRRYDSYVSEGLEVQAGRVSAMMANLAFATIYVKQNPSKVYGLLNRIDTEDYGVAVNKHHTALLNLINDVIKKMKADGTYQKMYNEYFVTMDWMSKVNLPKN
ncbi:MAG: transporter substrate-binding domain-containing protein [Chloroflexota bacterium]